MENSEKLKMCRTCENRRFNSKTGMTCSLSNSKPTFESPTCPNYVFDSSTYLRDYDKEQNEKAEVKSHKTTVLSFVWLFFIITIIGTIHSCITYRDLLESTSPIWWSLVLIMEVIYYVLWVKTLISFHKQKNNAIALILSVVATSVFTYLSEMVPDIIAGSIASTLPKYIINLTISAAVTAYLIFSENIDDVIPKESRTWEKPEKWLVGIYAVVCTIFYTLISFGIYLELTE